MLKIVICDDEPLFAQKLCGLVKDYFTWQHTAVQVDCYTSKRDFLFAPLAEYTVAFLDIHLPNPEGLDLAQKLREINPGVILVFVTSFIEHGPQGYPLKVFRYVLKPDLEQALPECLQALSQQLAAHPELFIFRTSEGETVTCAYDDLCYFESLGHHIVVHLKEPRGTRYTLYGSLSEVEARLPKPNFLRVQRSYIINLQNVYKIKGTQITLVDGSVVTGKREKAKDILHEYLQWRGVDPSEI